MKCLFCDEDIFKMHLCKKHYAQFVDEYKKIKENEESKLEYKQHYHNMRFVIIRQCNYDHIVNCSLRLIAIAYIFYKKYEDASLCNKVFNEIKILLEKKKRYIINNQKALEDIRTGKISDFDFRQKWSASFRCEDGHYVRSNAELLIDNWLYNHDIAHSYEKRCFIPGDIGVNLICDFYIKQCDTYIEYWGKYDKEYIARKKAKQECYNKNKINLIELEYEQCKRIDDILPELLRKFGYKF